MWYLQSDSVLYWIPEDPIVTPKIAAFDLVNTLIWTDRGDYTIRGPNTWIWRNEEIPKYLEELQAEGWTVVIFSNYISKHLEELQERFEEMHLPNVHFFASLKGDEYKKPNTGMWQLFLSLYPDLNVSQESFYVGDRAGDPNAIDPMFRKGTYTKLKDEEIGLYSYTGDDSLFSFRIGLHYHLPSELPEPEEIAFPEEQELIILVGQQGSGKTTYAIRVAEYLDYILVASEKNAYPESVVSPDKKRRLKIVEKLLSEGKSVVVDATHPTKASREDLISLAHRLKVPVRIFWASRPGRPYNELREKKVPEVALRTYTRLFERPSNKEASVVRIS